MRSRARLAGSFGDDTNTVSGWLNSRAIACIETVSSPTASSTTARGLPAKGRSVNTSSVANRRFIETSSSDRGPRQVLVKLSSPAMLGAVFRSPCGLTGPLPRGEGPMATRVKRAQWRARSFASAAQGFTTRPTIPADPLAWDAPCAGTTLGRSSSLVSPGASSFGSRSVATRTNV